MASGAVWGIDIGQCALKALRCRVHENPKKLTAEAFDYIEYPKILSQSGSDPAELIGDALKQFLSRNSVLGDRVAVSVSGQAGLARFIKLPPVESKKIPDIVRYEARQQIPFDLNDVVWDYQRMGVGSVEEGFALETEIGLFAMKRDAVFRALDPFLKLDIEVDIVQLTPLVLYNFLLFDQLDELPPADEYDPENPPESVVIISMGTDATDLVITNGYRVWQRSIPLGGSHFTKALIRELKLTFAKAEHLKRNATAAADPKAVFQAMRPVFSDLLDRVAAVDRLLLESRSGGQDRPGGGPGQRHETARPAPLPVAKPGLRDRENRILSRAGRSPGGHRAGVPGKRAVVPRLLRPGAARAGKERSPYEPPAEGDHPGPADQAQEALGGGRGGGAVARLSPSIIPPTAWRMGTVEQRRLEAGRATGRPTRRAGRRLEERRRPGPRPR